METKVSRGIVLYNRNYREDDKLVKIFTEESGKRMFFVRHASKSKLSAVIQPLTSAEFLLRINDNGLSYIDDYRSVTSRKQMNEDLFILSYATYVANLADSAIQDNEVDRPLFELLETTLNLMESGLDYEILTNIFEVQLLTKFGVQLNFHECVFCHRTGLPFDFSHRYSGVLCPEHYHEDLNRSHVHPNVIYLMNQFQNVSYHQLKTISIKPALKQEIRKFIDDLYDDYVGIHLKSKKFIDDLSDWGSIMRKDFKPKTENSEDKKVGPTQLTNEDSAEEDQSPR